MKFITASVQAKLKYSLFLLIMEWYEIQLSVGGTSHIINLTLLNSKYNIIRITIIYVDILYQPQQIEHARVQH